MAEVIGRAKVIIEGDVDSRSIDSAGGKIGKSLKAGALVGVAALGTLAVAGYKAFQSFEEAESVSRKLGNVLGNMGVGEATEQVEKLADALQRKTGVDDEVIKRGQTILATFSQVASSAGQLGGTFERATKLSLDLAAAGFGSVDSASKALGKALQDPEKGIAALSRAGVTFTEVQKEQIAKFIETGEVAKAQNLILEEVEKQVGGTAEAGATASDKMAAGIDEVKQSIGNLISELITGEDKNASFSDSLFDLADALNKLAESDAWAGIGSLARKLGNLFEYVADTIERIGDAWNGLPDLFTGGWNGTYKGSTTKELTSLLLGDRPGTNAAGDRNWRGGWTLVGEEGPELVNLPPGSDIRSNPESQRMLESSGGGVTVNQVFYGPTSTTDWVQKVDWATRFAPRLPAGTVVNG